MITMWSVQVPGTGGRFYLDCYDFDGDRLIGAAVWWSTNPTMIATTYLVDREEDNLP